MKTDSTPRGLAGRLAATFIDSKLTPIMVIASVLLGLLAVVMLPREEEPQIKVPMVDIWLSLPGASPSEVENQLTRPVEQRLWEVPGVEYLYSTSMQGGAMIVVRGVVGAELETILVRLHRQLDAMRDQMPPSAPPPLVKPRTIDDVPILALTFHGGKLDHALLRELALQAEETLKSLPNVAETMVIGGLSREVQIQLDPTRLTAYGLSPLEIAALLGPANTAADLGQRTFQDTHFALETGQFFEGTEDLSRLVVAVRNGRTIALGDVAEVVASPADPDQYVMHFRGHAGNPEPAVTLTFAKRPGSNAISVVEEVLNKVEELRGNLIPEEVGITVTRDYGHTAAEKSNELLLHMGIAVFGVAILILLFLGWRESLVVLVAIPSTLALTLLVFLLYGYTLNRITLFALIFSIGILVDDAIVVVENIVRHVRLPQSRRKPLNEVALEAVDEVGNPTILATWAVIAAILPMAFVGGLMGPYMRPIPIGSTAAMLFSLIIAFTITPWAAIRILKRHFGESSDTRDDSHDPDKAPDDWSTRLYHKVMDPMLDHARWRWAFLAMIFVLLLGAVGLVGIGAVEVKMLPFDNKSEFQIILNTEEGTSLEETTRIAQEMADAIRILPEVRDLQLYAGTAGPFNFNGLVRHYFIRNGSNVADLQVNLVGKGERSEQSHEIALRVRPMVATIAEKYGAAVAVAEVPPGPPVLQTIVMEVYAPTSEERLALATDVKAIMAGTDGVVDLDWYVEAPQPKIHYRIDREKAALHSFTVADLVQTLQLADAGLVVDHFHDPRAREQVPISLRLPDTKLGDPDSILDLQVRPPRRPNAPLVPLRELVTAQPEVVESAIYHKNLKPVIYVTGDVAGAFESPAYALFAMYQKISDLNARNYGGTDQDIALHHLHQPTNDARPAIKWDGEWHITLEVFRDLGLAFAAVLILIAMLMVGWFKNYLTPLIVMSAIPFSLIGILPAHWAIGAFFTATSMIGFMAGAGIVVRNSIILVDFIELRRAHGLSLRDAVVEAGAVRFRPMLLTALAVVVGASVILADPIFQGLAISLMFGEVASLLISRMAVPVLYFMVNHRAEKHAA